ncbi:transglycosylase domain-containing protein [Roseicella aquatilis]|uniref:peptidoglycan glycosyltransferase n=1 Tax=Roseicella aquatilis TaxID=2527868 RepID=A0A4R4DED4_9PROT|nr:transglycosylase domain-containing protein [Roseicella aquatilis]TCZ57836.1 penicillin-binding protein 1C [Roseicella aquatilis]
MGAGGTGPRQAAPGAERRPGPLRPVPACPTRSAWSRRLRWLAIGFGLLGGAAVALDRACPPDLSRLRAVGTEVLDREGRILSVLPAPGGTWRLATTARDVPPHLIAMLVAAEDRRFRAHPGVDPLALGRAAAQWARAGRVVSGGSTLTMQAARLLEPRPRTLRSKAIEMLRALQLEARFTKDEILGLWLTLAPMGGNLEGIRAGALAWFGRPAAGLDPAEAALLVAIPRRPEALRPDRHPEAARAARDAVLARRAAGAPGVGPGDLRRDASRPACQSAAADCWQGGGTPPGISALPRSALAGAVPATRLPMPGRAPHLARELARGTGGARIATTLDLPLQRAAEEIAAAALRDLPERASLALVVADLRDREVRALVGGAFGAEGRAGALDLTRTVRSPGSALKPALYALAFEAGLASPETLLEDLPRRFGAYAPENFSRGFAGRITVAEALRQSLNLPAVALLHEVGPIRFASALKLAGAPPRLPPGADPALPLALGGMGTTLREMVALYAALGDGGAAAPLRLQPAAACDSGSGDGAPAPPGRCGPSRIACRPEGRPAPAPCPPAQSVQAFAPRAAGLAAAILVQPFPAGGPMGIAWKTGTSWGGRDAWALGLDARHVVGVWVGRPDGTPLPGATGARTALPILARLFERLPPAPREALPVRAAPPAGAEPLDRLRLAFPPPGAVLEGGDGHVTLRAAGGRRPLTFLVDGAPLPAEPARREAAWTPPGPGFYRVTVLDAVGAAARAEVRVR